MLDVFEGRDRGAASRRAGTAVWHRAHIAGRAQSIAAGIDAARACIDSGAARSWLKQLQDFAANRSGTQGRRMSGFLDEMARSSAQRVRQAVMRESLAALERRAREAPHSAAAALVGAGVRRDRRTQAEIAGGRSLGSPSEDWLKRVAAYAHGGAAAVSVLTEPSRFDGSLQHLHAGLKGAEALGNTGDAQGFSARSVPGAGGEGRRGGRRAVDTRACCRKARSRNCSMPPPRIACSCCWKPSTPRIWKRRGMCWRGARAVAEPRRMLP